MPKKRKRYTSAMMRYIEVGKGRRISKQTGRTIIKSFRAIAKLLKKIFKL